MIENTTKAGRTQVCRLRALIRQDVWDHACEHGHGGCSNTEGGICREEAEEIVASVDRLYCAGHITHTERIRAAGWTGLPYR